MTGPRVLLSRLWSVLRARQVDRDIDDEIAGHLADATEEYVRQGLSLEEATRAARRDFGGVMQTKEVCRQVQSFVWLDDLARDLAYALRALRRNRAFAVAAGATLALAIGTNTAMFSALDAVLFRPLPYKAPEQLAMLWMEDPTQNIREGRSALTDVEQWRSQTRSFADMATFDAVSTTLTGADGAEQIVGASVSPNLLPLLGIQPVRGRSFTTGEAVQRERLVLISHRFWLARFAGSNDAIGAALVLDGCPFQIIGVLPRGFQIASVDADVWTAHSLDEQSGAGHDGGERSTWFVVGRLGPAVTFEQAQAEMSAMARRLNATLPSADRNRGISVVPLSVQMVGMQSRLALWMLGGAVLCVFLIAVANVASLSLARSFSRAREMATRAALGASAGRIVRQLLTETILLAAVSGLIGTVLGVAGIRLIRAFGPGNLPRLDEMRLDVRVVGWTMAISVLGGILTGMTPAIMTLRRNLGLAAHEGGRGVSGGVSTRRLRRVLVVVEFALAIVLLTGAGLLVRSWWYVTNVDPGFRPERVLVMELSAPTSMSAAAQRFDMYQRTLEQIQAVPGVEKAGLIGDLFIVNSREQVVTADGDLGAVSERLRLRRDEVSADFFTAIGTPLLRGRLFSDADGPDAPPVAIINDAMARQAWPDRDPVGRRFKLGAPASDRPWYTVVGVVGNMRRQGPEREALPQMFVPLAQSAPGSVDLVARTSSRDPLAMAGALRAAVRRVDKNAPIYGVAPLEQELGAYLTQRRFETLLLVGFSVVALLMAVVGINGLIHFSIATRTNEIGLRMAIGAEARDIFRMILGEGLALSMTGLILGLVGAWWLGRAESSLVFGVRTSDALTFVTVSLLLIVVAAAACYFPARRAMKVDPVEALRVT